MLIILNIRESKMAYSLMFSTSIYLTLLVVIYAQEKCLIPPPEVQNARSVITNTTQGVVIEYHCARHFRKSFKEKITCIDGKWTGEPPVCKDTRCYVESLWKVGIEKSNKTVYFNRQTVTLSCIAGYDLIAIRRNIVCNFGRWMIPRSSPCEPARCKGEPPEISNGEILNYTKTHLSNVSYKCNQGYEMVYSPETVKCMYGLWTGLTPLCRQSFNSSDVVSCMQLEAPRNGNIVSSLGRQTAGSIIQYVCNPNYDMVGVATTTCLESGKWTSPPPVCIEKCIIPNVENGMIQARLEHDRFRPQSFMQPGVNTRVQNGTELYVICNSTNFKSPYFEPFGIQSKAFEISCINGVWSPEPKCIEKIKCEIPKDLQNGKVYYDSLEKGSDLYYECEEGFQLDVIQTRICSDNGKWTGEEPSCREPCTIPKVENGVIGEYKKMYKYEGGIRTEMIFSESVVHSRAKNNTLLFKCTDTRFEPTGAQAKELNISCINGIWSHPLTCIAASCKKPPQVENAVILTKDIAHGTILRYVCAKNFTKKSFGAVTCQYGQWKGQLPICISTLCHTKDIRPDEGIVNSEVSEAVAPGNYADISCKEKYYLKYEKPRCLNGTWSYQNEFSPCQIRDHCIVPDIQGTFSRPVHLNRFDFWRSRHRSILENTKVEPGWRTENGEELSVKCNPSHFFPDGADTGNFSVSCVGGDWHPSPICKPKSIALPIFKEVKSSTSTISFAWDFPSNLVDNIDGYVLSCEERGKEKTSEKTETFIDKIHRNYTIKNLEPSKEYQIILQAYKSDIRSEPVASLVKTLPDFKVPPAAVDCSIPSLVDNLPENVVIDVEIEDIVSETVPEGRIFRLTCGTVGMQLIGEHSAICDYNGRWKVGKDVKCVIACGTIKKPVGSNLIIEPEKDMYRFGETVIFSCPLGQELNSTTVRIMCLKRGWSSESVPHCRI